MGLVSRDGENLCPAANQVSPAGMGGRREGYEDDALASVSVTGAGRAGQVQVRNRPLALEWWHRQRVWPVYHPWPCTSG